MSRPYCQLFGYAEPRPFKYAAHEPFFCTTCVQTFGVGAKYIRIGEGRKYCIPCAIKKSLATKDGTVIP